MSIRLGRYHFWKQSKSNQTLSIVSETEIGNKDLGETNEKLSCRSTGLFSVLWGCWIWEVYFWENSRAMGRLVSILRNILKIGIGWQPLPEWFIVSGLSLNYFSPSSPESLANSGYYNWPSSLNFFLWINLSLLTWKRKTECDSQLWCICAESGSLLIAMSIKYSNNSRNLQELHSFTLKLIVFKRKNVWHTKFISRGNQSCKLSCVYDKSTPAQRCCFLDRCLSLVSS